MSLPARPVSAAQPPLTDKYVSTARPDPIGSDRVAQSGCKAAYHGLLAVMREVKDGVRVFVIQVIEEDAAAASAFIVSVLDHKVVITPLLELGPVLWVVLITHRLSSRHTMAHSRLHSTAACYTWYTRLHNFCMCH